MKTTSTLLWLAASVIMNGFLKRALFHGAVAMWLGASIMMLGSLGTMFAARVNDEHLARRCFIGELKGLLVFIAVPLAELATRLAQ